MERIKNEARAPLIAAYNKAFAEKDLSLAGKTIDDLRMIYGIHDEELNAMYGQVQDSKQAVVDAEKQKKDAEKAKENAKEDAENAEKRKQEREKRDYLNLSLYQVHSETDFEDGPTLTSVQKDQNDKYRERQQKAFDGKWVRGWQLQVWNVYDDHICLNDPNIVALFYNTMFKKYGWCYVSLEYEKSSLDSMTIGRLKRLSKGQFVTIGYAQLHREFGMWWVIYPVEDLYF